MHLLADVGQTATPFLTALGASAGVLGALLGYFKLRGERDSMAVSQAQGAAETMETVLEALERANERANARGDFYKDRCDELEAKLDAINREWGPFPIADET